nr:ATP-binding cassette subfamily G-like 11-1 [Brachionus rubens]
MNENKASLNNENIYDKPLTLTWENITIKKSKASLIDNLKHSYLNSPFDNTKEKTIVQNVTGIAKPYEILAILGPSGSGKTSLLNALNFRNRESLKVTGDVKINQNVIDSLEKISTFSGYVQQDDLFIGCIKVKEWLEFQANLKMDRCINDSEKKKRITDVLIQFGLKKCENALIGSPELGIKGISGGERRRLSFASEIITNPSILFCDEPTSGLDSYMAMSIVDSMKNLAKHGKTIIFTIHQPSSEIFEMFDKICLISEGRLVFLGDRFSACDFFESQGYKSPSNYNPADHFIKTLSITSIDKQMILERVNSISSESSNPSEVSARLKCITKVNSFADNFQKSPFCESILSDIKSTNQLDINFSLNFNRYKSSLFRQIKWLLWRNLLAVYRDPVSTRIVVIQSLIMGLIYGLIFYKMELNQEGIMNINSLLFLAIVYASVIYLFGEIKVFPIEIQIFLREHHNKLYSVFSYYLTKSLVELPIHVLMPATFTLIFYLMVGINSDVSSVVSFTFFIILVAQCGVSLGHFLSAVSKSVSVASGLAGPILGPLMIFSGFLLNNSSVPTYFLWLKYLSWLSYANEGLMIIQWRNIPKIDCDEKNFRCLSNGKDVLAYFNIDENQLPYTIYMQLFLIIGWRTMSFFVLLIKSYAS